MPRRCPFDPTKKCGRPITACPDCDIRRKAGQTILVRDNPLKASGMTTKIETIVEKINCPYCLYHDYAMRFQIKNKSGKISEKRFRCPDCGEVMRKDTLFKQMSVEEYAEWIFDTQAWERIKFDKFKARLRDMGIAYKFWEHYKEYKKKMTSETESYQDYIMRKQQEEHDEQMDYTDMHGE